MKNHSRLLSNAGSISSCQSFDTIRVQSPSTAATSIAGSDDHRWSEIVPPESGLTFAVVWDPEEKDLVTFSSPELSDCHERAAQSPDSPTDACDNRSQVLTIGPSLADYTATPATMQFFRQNHDFLFTDPKFFPDRPARGRTQTSSTLDGLDELDGDFAFDPCTSFAHMWMKDMRKGEVIRDDVSDEGFFEGGQFGGMGGEVGMDGEVILSSRFSGTTTSTSNFITVENEMDDGATADWSALEAPNTPGYSHLGFSASPSASHRRLRKTRPLPGPASPSDVLDRPEYSHNVPIPDTPEPPRSRTPTPRCRTPLSHVSASRTLSHMRSLPKIARNLTGKWKKTEDAGWVYINVKDRSASL
ncbi:DJ-1 protein-PfpI domain-containing protein [Mycena venus]|uniref:DJ-1 protein-PfpI domain-containing protein n=1 Tax=Mycena venus TaxID=2733690 RepID=A0A8H6XM91_9AGAR|nr:DJ-1 protein-PfpI domain-containing protein [Mycena venus]